MTRANYLDDNISHAMRIIINGLRTLAFNNARYCCDFRRLLINVNCIVTERA